MNLPIGLEPEILRAALALVDFCMLEKARKSMHFYSLIYVR